MQSSLTPPRGARTRRPHWRGRPRRHLLHSVRTVTPLRVPSRLPSGQHQQQFYRATELVRAAAAMTSALMKVDEWNTVASLKECLFGVARHARSRASDSTSARRNVSFNSLESAFSAGVLKSIMSSLSVLTAEARFRLTLGYRLHSARGTRQRTHRHRRRGSAWTRSHWDSRHRRRVERRDTRCGARQRRWIPDRKSFCFFLLAASDPAAAFPERLKVEELKDFTVSKNTRTPTSAPSNSPTYRPLAERSTYGLHAIVLINKLNTRILMHLADFDIIL